MYPMALFLRKCFIHIVPSTSNPEALASIQPSANGDTRKRDVVWTHQFGDVEGMEKKLGVFFKYFILHPYLGKIPILTNIFQIG